MVLLWLVPTVVVTVVAMLWVSWAGRDGRGEVDREVALQRMGRVLDPSSRRGLARLRRTRPVPSYVVTPRRDRSTGIAVRPSRPPSPSQAPRAEGPARPEQRRAS